MVVALLGAMFAFIGAEIVTVAAAEAKPKQRNHPHHAFGGMAHFLVLMFDFHRGVLDSYTEPGLKDSTLGTYAVTMQHLGIPYAKQIVNFVVLTSVCSCFNLSLVHL